jgi:hypothetical protein
MAYLNINLPFETWVLMAFYFALLAVWMKGRERAEQLEKKLEALEQKGVEGVDRADAQYADLVAAMKAEREYIDSAVQSAYNMGFEEKLALSEELGGRLEKTHAQFNRFHEMFEKWGKGYYEYTILRDESSENVYAAFTGRMTTCDILRDYLNLKE